MKISFSYIILFFGFLLMMSNKGSFFYIGEIITIIGVFSLYTNAVKWKNANLNNLEKENQSNYKYCILLLLAKVMKADGTQMSNEFDRVEETIKRYFKKSKRQDALRLFQNLLKEEEKYELENICTEIRSKFDYLAMAELIMELLAVAYADDEYLESEEEIIDQIVKELGISQIQYNSIYTLFMKKYEQGHYSKKTSQEKSKTKSNKRKDNSNNQNSSKDSSKYNDSDYKANESQKQSPTTISREEREAYDMLGVSHSVSDDEVKKAYRAMAIKYHPDNAASLGDEAVRQANETMKLINKAWDTVKTARGIK